MHPATLPARSSLFVVTLCFLTIVADGYDLIVFRATLPRLLEGPGRLLPRPAHEPEAPRVRISVPRTESAVPHTMR